MLTCTQKSRLYLPNVQSIDIYTMYRLSLIELLAEITKIPNLHGGPVSCSWWRIPIHSGPLPGSNCPPFGSYPLHSFPTPQPTLNYLQRRHQQSRSSSSGTFTSQKAEFNKCQLFSVFWSQAQKMVDEDTSDSLGGLNFTLWIP
jgi:hypothetical protein